MNKYMFCEYSRKLEIVIFFLVVSIILGCNSENSDYIYETNSLKIIEVSENAYQHISYLDTKSYGKVDCNGVVFVDGGEAIIIDTPVDNASTQELIGWVEKDLKLKIKAVVPTHFHVDCLGGLDAFSQKGIISYSNRRTIDLARIAESQIPDQGFEKSISLKVGEEEVICSYFGEGHTVDNIVCYFPSEDVLFGGCLIKSMGAVKGNLDDANVAEWSKTVASVKEVYSDMKIVIPGHGKSGNSELLDFTIDLFK